MKIDDKKIHEVIPFEDLPTGEIFTSCGYYYMKARGITSETGALYNAVELLDGVFAQFTDLEEVEVVQGKLVIE